MKDFFVKHKKLTFILLGIINALPFTFEGLFFVSWISLAPLFILMTEEASKKSILINSFLFFFSFHFLIYHFFVALIPLSFAGLGYVSSFLILFLAWCALSSLHSILFALLFTVIAKLRFTKPVKIISLALSFVLIQYFQSFGTYGFTWSRISLPQSVFLPIIQSASLLGPYFVDLLLVLTNAFIAVALVTKRYGAFITLAVSLFFVNFLFGVWHMSKPIESEVTKSVTIVQGNVLTDEKWNGKSSYAVYMTETLLLDKFDTLVVWGETAIPTDLNTSKKILAELETYTKFSTNDMLVGAFYTGNVGNEYNGAYYISNGEMSDNVYFKRRLVPFGEFLPFRKVLELFPILDDINLLSVDLTAGRSSSILDTEEGRIGRMICFDSIFSTLARESVSDGAELLVVITNDAWYKDFPAVYQHNNQAKWRAVENGRYLVRSANSGISSFITPYGETLSSLPPLTKGTLTEDVAFISSKTLYTQLGDVIIIPLAIWLAVILFITIKNSRFIGSSRMNIFRRKDEKAE